MKRVLSSMLIAVAAFGLSGCAENFEWNQKLTVVVSTPAGDVSGASVVHYSSSAHSTFATGNALTSSVSGEATVVEVAPGKYLFALLDGSQEIATWTFQDRLPDGGTAERQRALQSQRGARAVPRDHFPMLVMFSNISDPKSVKEVKPDKLSDAFGAGYSLKSITLEITDEVMTDGEIINLPFWQKLEQQRTLSGLTKFDKSRSDPINYLTYDVFIKGN